MERDESFGIIPLSKIHGAWHVLLIQHRKGRYWGFPKGHAEEGETAQESACRELYEETNLKVVRNLQEDPLGEEYVFLKMGRKVKKKVLYFIAEVEGDLKIQEGEIYAAQWVSFPECLTKITHQESREILSHVSEMLQKLD